MELQAELNRLAKTNGLGEAMAACIWAGIPIGMQLQGALNAKASSSGLAPQGAANKIAGTSGLGTKAALMTIATPP